MEQKETPPAEKRFGLYKLQFIASGMLLVASLGAGMYLISSGKSNTFFLGIIVLLAGSFLPMSLFADRAVHLNFGDDKESHIRHRQVKRGVAYKRYSKNSLLYGIPGALWFYGGLIGFSYLITFHRDFDGGLGAFFIILWLVGDIIALVLLNKAAKLIWQCPYCGEDLPTITLKSRYTISNYPDINTISCPHCRQSTCG